MPAEAGERDPSEASCEDAVVAVLEFLTLIWRVEGVRRGAVWLAKEPTSSHTQNNANPTGFQLPANAELHRLVRPQRLAAGLQGRVNLTLSVLPRVLPDARWLAEGAPGRLPGRLASPS
jgi:hypothetical protein